MGRDLLVPSFCFIPDYKSRLCTSNAWVKIFYKKIKYLFAFLDECFHPKGEDFSVLQTQPFEAARGLAILPNLLWRRVVEVVQGILYEHLLFTSLASLYTA